MELRKKDTGKFMKNVTDTAKIAKFKYPQNENTIVLVFDQSSCHCVFAEDTLNPKVMNMSSTTNVGHSWGRNDTEDG